MTSFIRGVRRCARGILEGVRLTSVARAAAGTVLLCVVGCLGDDPEPGGAVGSSGAACYSNGTCNVGLICDRGTVCVPTDGGAAGDGGSDAGAAGPDGSDASATACPHAADAGAELACGASLSCSGATPVCCFGATLSSCQAPAGESCASSMKEHRCDSRAACAGAPCCLQTTDAALEAQATCPRTLPVAQLTATACGTCGAGDYAVCANDGECEGGRTCQRLDVTSTLNGTLALGICLPR